MLQSSEGRRPILLVQIQQQLRAPSRAVRRSAAHQAGDHYSMEEHVKTPGRKAAEFVRHGAPSRLAGTFQLRTKKKRPTRERYKGPARGGRYGPDAHLTPYGRRRFHPLSQVFSCRIM